MSKLSSIIMPDLLFEPHLNLIFLDPILFHLLVVKYWPI